MVRQQEQEASRRLGLTATVYRAARGGSIRVRAKGPIKAPAILPRSCRPPMSPAGQLIERLLKSAKLSRQRFAEAIDETPMEVTRLIDGDKRILPDLAARLERFFDVSAKRWLSLQMRFDLAHRNPAHRAEVARKIPTLKAVMGALRRDGPLSR